MGASGMKNLIALGIAHMRTLSIGHVGITHHFGTLVGEQLREREFIQRTRFDEIQQKKEIPQNSLGHIVLGVMLVPHYAYFASTQHTYRLS